MITPNGAPSSAAPDSGSIEGEPAMPAPLPRQGIRSLAAKPPLCDVASGADPTPFRIRAGEVELHYIEKGCGHPLILLHGGTGDYRAWLSHLDCFAGDYRVIAYSRRHSFPNTNGPAVSNYSAIVDAGDLGSLLRRLDIDSAHLVGTSYGALTALTLATRDPARVRSLVLAEPPLHAWLEAMPCGKKVYQDFIRRTWEPARTAFRANRTGEAMKILVDGFAGCPRFDDLSTEARNGVMENAAGMAALVLSTDAFPCLAPHLLRPLHMPVLVVGGEHSTPIHKLGREELLRALPHAAHLIVPGAGHALAQEKPDVFAAAVLAFVADA